MAAALGAAVLEELAGKLEERRRCRWWRALQQLARLGPGFGGLHLRERADRESDRVFLARAAHGDDPHLRPVVRDPAAESRQQRIPKVDPARRRRLRPRDREIGETEPFGQRFGQRILPYSLEQRETR
jgi:hypothetical protein